ncbi:VBP1 [Symbiodinium sp. KB8]|nr:VBP1 [Symbiodinium sp. KB8]
MDTHFSLSDLVYASAKVEPVDHVCLWLGADVMLEYSLDDAEALLTKNLETAKNKLDQIDEDLDFLRDQTITTEVNVARVFNYDVKIRREKGEISK